MARVLFFSYPLFGHVNYGQKLAKILISMGEQVYYFSTKKYKDMIESSGAKFVEYNYQFKQTRNAEKEVNYIYEALSLGVHVLDATRSIMQQDAVDWRNRYQPDYILYDSLAIWGYYFARYYNIPAISSVSIYAYSKKMVEKDPVKFIRCMLRMENDELFKEDPKKSLMRILKQISNQVKSKYPEFSDYEILDTMYGKEDLNIHYNIREMQVMQECFPRKTDAFIGPLIEEREREQDVSAFVKTDKRIIYVSLGTIHNDASVYKMIFESLKEMPCQIIFSIGNTIPKDIFGMVPDNIIITDRVPQIALLKYVDLFITHGGANSAREAIYWNVPMLVIPKALDHYLVAEDIRDKKLGIYLEEVSTDSIFRASKEILECKEKYQSLELSESIRKVCEENRVPELIVEFKQKNNIL